MRVKVRKRLTRAEAEGVRYKLPAGKKSKIFEEQFNALRDKPDALLEVLHLAQETFGYLSKPVLGWVAQEFKIPKNDVYATATFYSLFTLKPEARYVIRVCDCLPCYLLGGESVLQAIRDEAQISDGETSGNGRLFSLESVSCLGLCDQAPAMLINEERYGFLTPQKARDIIAGLRKKHTGGKQR